MVGRENAIHVGVAVFDPLDYLLLTCHAATQEDFLPGVAAFGVGQSAQIAEYTLLGMLPDSAGIHNHHICTFCLIGYGVSALRQNSADAFGVGFVLLTAVGLHIGGGDGIPLHPVHADSITKGELCIKFFLGNNGGFRAHQYAP